MRPLTPLDLSLFLLRFRHLTAAGLPPDQSLTQIAASTADPALKKTLQQTVVTLRNGASLAEALCPDTGHPFPPFVRNSLQAAGSGINRLDQALDGALRYVASTPRESGWHNHLQNLLFLLAPLLLFLLGSVLVVPVFTSMFADLGGDLPGLTKLFIDVAAFANRYLVIILALIGGGSWYYLKHQRLMIRDYDRAAAFGLMARGATEGYAVKELFHLAAAASSNKTVQDRLHAAATLLENGQSLAEALKQTKLISAFAAILMGLEDQLQPGGQLTALAEHYQAAVRKATGRISLLGAVSVLICGLLLLSMILSMYLPIFKMAGTVG